MTASPRPGRTTGSGTRWRSWRCARRRCSRPTTPTTSWRPCATPGLVPATRSPPRSMWFNPGGAAQTVHRDYHLGFQTSAQAARYPAHVHRLSPVLTLQGAVAHLGHGSRDRPHHVPAALAEVPARLPGLLAAPVAGSTSRRIMCSCRCARGDAVFFDPALFHAAALIRTAGVRRMASLLQVSSAFGRAMEAVDRGRMCAAVFPALLAMATPGRPSRRSRTWSRHRGNGGRRNSTSTTQRRAGRPQRRSWPGSRRTLAAGPAGGRPPPGPAGTRPSPPPVRWHRVRSGGGAGRAAS